ncbi:MAG: HEAT repeat domain-containing protein [Bryobacterales bacterium]|nr:HEAT repeat domain-containing protein [Bryobacterales bacterium]
MLKPLCTIAFLAVLGQAQDPQDQERIRAVEQQVQGMADALRAASGSLRSADQNRLLEQDLQRLRDSMKPLAQELEKQTRLEVELQRAQQESVAQLADKMRRDEAEIQWMAQKLATAPPPPPGAPIPPKPFVFGAGSVGGTSEERLYRSGKSQLEDRDWDDALKYFNRVIELKGSRADAAMYWKAYTQNRLGHRTEALSTLAEMMRVHPQSRWLDDARALEVEVKQSAGQPVSLESEADEDLKILAVNGMIHTDPDRAIPVLEKLIAKSASPRLRERAVFVLAQSRTPRGREALLALAKGGTNPDLQYKAVEYLGYQSTPETRQTLQEIYSSSSDVQLKRAVLRGFMASRDKDRLLTAAKTEQVADLRKEAIRGLGSVGANEELWQLYQAESSAEVKTEILYALPGKKENADRLIEAAKSERDAKLRRELVRQIGYTKAEKVPEVLASMYGPEQDMNVKRAIIDGLRHSGSAKALVDITKSETDLKLKRSLVETLSHMKQKEATDYLMEMLNK